MPTKWYESNKRLFVEEKDFLAIKYPFLKMEILPSGTRINKVFALRTESAIVSGIYRLLIPDSQRYLDYRIVVLLPDNYPRRIPRMYCNDRKLPIGNINRHIMSDGSACLGVNAEISQKWRYNSRIVPFLDEIVAPFLVWQTYYDEHRQPPPWGQRSHYDQGILEFYSELLGITAGHNVETFMKLLARKNHPKGHEECPCGTGRRLRDCHIEHIRKAREQVGRQDVCEDLSIIEQRSDKG